MADFGLEFTSTSVVEKDDIFFGMADAPISAPLTLVTSPTAYKRGDAVALNTSTAKYQLYDEDGSNGLNIVAGILIEDYDASGGDIAYAKIYTQGEFLKGKIHASDPEELAVGIYGYGNILVKEAK